MLVKKRCHKPLRLNFNQPGNIFPKEEIKSSLPFNMLPVFLHSIIEMEKSPSGDFLFFLTV